MNTFILRYKCALKAALTMFNLVRVIHMRPGDSIKIAYALNIEDNTKAKIVEAVDSAAKKIKTKVETK